MVQEVVSFDSVKKQYVAAVVLIFIIAAVVMVSGYTNQQPTIVCNRPYIQVGTSCCLDKNDNSICDSDEEETQDNVTTGQKNITEGCVPDWKCIRWSDCLENNTKTRICLDNKCGLGTTEESGNCNYVAELGGYVIVDDLRYEIISLSNETYFVGYKSSSSPGSVVHPINGAEFLFLGIVMTNTGLAAQKINLSKLVVVDFFNRSFDRIRGGIYSSILLKDSEEIAPYFSSAGYVFFEIPVGEKQMKLRVVGNSREEDKYIEIGDFSPTGMCKYANMEVNVEIKERSVYINNTSPVALTGFNVTVVYTGRNFSWVSVKRIYGKTYDNLESSRQIYGDVVGISVFPVQCPSLIRYWKNS